MHITSRMVLNVTLSSDQIAVQAEFLKLWPVENLGMTCDVDEDFASNFIKLKKQCSKKELSKKNSVKKPFFKVEDHQMDKDECLMFTQQDECSSYCLRKRKQV
jgi:hypothetical protein